MLKNFKSYITYFVAFFVFIEMSFSLKYFNDYNFYQENIIPPKIKLEKKFNENLLFLNDSIQKKLILIGASYFDYPLGKDSYDERFKEWASQNEYKFINLSQGGTKVEDHYSFLSKIPDYVNNIYIISYIPTNVFRDYSEDHQNTSQLKESSPHLFNIIKNTHSMRFLKDILHQVSIKLIKQPFYSTSTRKSMINPGINNLNNLNNFLNYLNDKRGKVILVVNFPFNFKYDFDEMVDWDLYKFFKNIDNKLKIILTPEIINSSESVNWRNGHPNSKSVKKIFNEIVNEIEAN